MICTAQFCILDERQNRFPDESCSQEKPEKLTTRYSRESKFEDDLHANDDVYDIITSELKTLQVKFPHRFQKSTFVLPIVDLTMPDQWKERLIQAQNVKSGECTIIIICYVGNSLWIGVIIKFNAHEQIRQAEFFDQIIESGFVPNILQDQFTEVFQGFVLHAGDCEKHIDRKQSARLMVDKLLSAAEVSKPTQIEEELPITKEYLKNLYNDFSSMPNCAEKSIIILLYDISLQLASKTLLSDNTILVPDQIGTKIEKEFQFLKERLKIEESKYAKIHNTLEICSTYVKNKDWKLVMATLRKILKGISPLNIPEMFRLIENVNDAAKFLKDQSVILFLGGTGSGKSTIIHFLAGSKMIETKVKGLNHIAIDYTSIKYPDLKKVTVSPFAQSETRYITPVRVNFYDVGAFREGSIILCDSPGFEDTGGPEIDIANGIGIVRAIKGCKSVRPVILLSYKSIGDKFEGFKSLAHILVGLMPGIADNLRAFSYIFTKYPLNERDGIHDSLKNVKENMKDEEKSDTGFISLFNDMLRKTRKGALCIDPTKDDPGEILDELANSVEIAHPDEVFQFYIAENSKSVVKEQISKHQSYIQSAIKRSEYSLVKYKLDQLKQISELLELDYIKQTYHDSIRDVSKHLNQEYQESVDVLQRCFRNEQVLNDEVIKQLQMHIEHAALAEGLREVHLGKEVVSTSAFIQYMHERVDGLLEDLEQKDIDESSVIHSLNILKFLSEAFTDIRINYRNICQIFNKKLEMLVDSFKLSVLSKDFNKSATDMEKLYESQTTLQDHLDHKDIKNKYAQLQDYFMKYLTDSVEKLNYLFKQEKLEKSDIDQLNDLVDMLHTVKNTYSLQRHISIKRVNEIYDEFILKISNYFNKIIENTKVQFKEEDPSHKLKQSLEQLDLIRSISIIALKTSQSYFSTLEEICGSIRELKRDVDKTLAEFYRNEERINYSTLTKHLFKLKSVEWFKTYRPEVYSDVMTTIEEQIIQHVKDLAHSAKSIHLDLDNHNKLKNVDKIISKLNSMQPIEKIVPSISQYRNDTNAWLENIIGTVLTLINNTFNFEKYKEQNYPSYDINKLEKAFSYLDACENISIIPQSNLISVRNNLAEFVKEFYRYIENEMENYFESIQQYSNENDDIIFKNAQQLSNHLEELKELKEQHRGIFSYLLNQKIIDKWETKLTNYQTHLSDEMEMLRVTQQVQKLTNKLFIAKVLSILDDFVKKKKYIDSYNNYRNIFYNQNIDVLKNVIHAIKADEYEQVATEMIVLQSSNEVGQHFYKQAKQSLNIGLKNLIDTTKSLAIKLGNEIKIEDMASIVKHLKRIEAAKQFTSSHLDREDLILIDETIKHVEALIEDRIRAFLEKVNANLNANNFYEAENRIELITTVRTLLGKYCTIDSSKNIEKLREKQKEVVLEDSVKTYLNMSIADYIWSPPTDIFQKFDEVKNMNPIYEQALKQIQDGIIAKFREELRQAVLKIPPNPDNQYIRNFENAFKYLPEKWRDALEIELKNCKENIQSNIKNIENDLNDAINSGNLSNIRIFIENYQSLPGMQAYANRGRERALQKFQEIKSKLDENIQNNFIEKALDYVKKLYDYENELGDVVVEIRKLYSDVRESLRKTFDKAYNCFMNNFFDIKILSTMNEIIDETNKAFKDLIEFMKFRDEFESKTTLNNMLSEDINEKLLIIKQKLVKGLKEHQKNYENALTEMTETNIDILKYTLDNMKKWDSIFVNIPRYVNMNYGGDTFVSNIMMTMRNITSYSEMIKTILQKIEGFTKYFKNTDFINEETKELSKSRDEFYKKLNEKIIIFDKIKIFSEHMPNIDFRDFYQECLNSIEKQIAQMCSVVENLIEKISTAFILKRQDYDTFSLYYSNLIAFKKEVKVKDIKTNGKINQVERNFFEIIGSWVKSALEDKTLGKICETLKYMKQVANNIPLCKKQINEDIDSLLYEYKRSTKDAKIFAKLGTLLHQDKSDVSQSIIAEHKAFQGFALSLFNEKTKRHGIDYVLQHITGNNINKSLLKKRFDEFDEIYRELIRKYLKVDMKIDELISETKLISNVKQSSDNILWDNVVRSKVPKLMAHIFALWTLKNADHFFQADDSSNKENYLLQPHAAQVISIFRMLGIGDEKEILKNNLVQIGTGEGKSITLGVTAAVLALLDFDIYSACYSEYLSQRDYNSFLPLFDSLGLLNHIHYGTFKQLCERVMNENGHIREIVEQMISNNMNNSKPNNQPINRAKILLIDEVDVFFSGEFYGNLYTPSATLRDPTIKALTNYIWERRKTGLTFKGIKTTSEYQVCCQKFQDWEPLIAEAVKDMLYDVMNFESHDYLVSQDKIGYIEQDNVVFNVVYRYKTLFAYFLEHEKGTISRKSLEENVSIYINCGSFSYAEIPHQFVYIMGVTGTLKTLSDPEKDVIQNVYHISKYTYSPSVFGQNNLKFVEKDDIMIENNDDYFTVIKSEIDRKLVGKAEGKRAVLIFFDSEKKLKDFYESSVLKEIKESVAKLTEEASPEEKETLIKRATTPGQITLLTRIFGRGTDFICYDESVALNGGTHVIQTFLSEELSEEVQIKGRTARQGDLGSYSMVLLDRDLEKFHIMKENIENVKQGKGFFGKIWNTAIQSEPIDTVYKLLDAKRTDLFKTQYDANRKHVEYAKEKHQTAQNFLSSLYSGDINAVRNFLVEENKGVGLTSNSRTICLMDATYSMVNLLNSCKNTVSTMFERASEVLKDHSIDSNAFQIQFVVYRNYNSKEDKILQASPWEIKSNNLRNFINSIEAEDGWRNEAIEIGLWHATKEHEREPITQVILIGDAPPNTEDEVQSKRSDHFGNSYWKNTKFADVTYYEKELAKLILNNIPVHGFYVAAAAENSFKEIAMKSGGRSEMLDINSPEGSKILTDLVTEEILRNVGGSSHGNTLVEAYRSKYGKSYTN